MNRIDDPPKSVLDQVGDPASSAISTSPGDGKVSLSLQMAPVALRRLERLAASAGTSVDVVISKAFVLYEAAADAHHAGKAVGVAASPDVLETEFVGFE